MKAIKGVRLGTAHEAVQHAEAAGGESVRLEGAYYVVSRATADGLAAAGVSFAYVEADDDGRLFTVPVN
jgi:hypothetical protein